VLEWRIDLFLFLFLFLFFYYFYFLFCLIFAQIRYYLIRA